MNPLSMNAQAPSRCWVKEESFARSCSKQGVIESQNGLGWKGSLKAIYPNPPAVSRDIFN